MKRLVPQSLQGETDPLTDLRQPCNCGSRLGLAVAGIAVLYGVNELLGHPKVVSRKRSLLANKVVDSADPLVLLRGRIHELFHDLERLDHRINHELLSLDPTLKVREAAFCSVHDSSPSICTQLGTGSEADGGFSSPRHAAEHIGGEPHEEGEQ